MCSVRRLRSIGELKVSMHGPMKFVNSVLSPEGQAAQQELAPISPISRPYLALSRPYLQEELAAAAALAAEAWAKGREEHSDLRSWEALSGLARVLVASLSSGLASRAEEAELRAKLAAMTARLQAVFGLGAAAAPAAAPEAPAEAQVATPNKIVGFEVEATLLKPEPEPKPEL